MSTDNQAPPVAEDAYDAFLRHHDELDAKALADRDARHARETKEQASQHEAEARARAEAKPEPAGSYEPAPDYYSLPAPPFPSHEEATRREFERYASQLVPGAAAALARMNAERFGVLSPEQRASQVAKFMATGMAKRYLDPEAIQATLESGRPMGPVRAALSRYSAELKPGAVEELTKAWSVELVGRDPVTLAGEVVKRLGKPENAKYLTRPVDRSFDRRLPAKPAAKVEAPRNDQGRFQQQPPEKRRPSSTF